MAPSEDYVRVVKEVKDVHDGDTYRFLVDQGLGDSRDMWVRLRGIDTLELSQPKGTEARDVVRGLFSHSRQIVIQTFKTSGGEDRMTFIRYVGDVWVDGVSLKEYLELNHPWMIKPS